MRHCDPPAGYSGQGRRLAADRIVGRDTVARRRTRPNHPLVPRVSTTHWYNAFAPPRQGFRATCRPTASPTNWFAPAREALHSGIRQTLPHGLAVMAQRPVSASRSLTQSVPANHWLTAALAGRHQDRRRGGAPLSRHAFSAPSAGNRAMTSPCSPNGKRCRMNRPSPTSTWSPAACRRSIDSARPLARSCSRPSRP